MDLTKLILANNVPDEYFWAHQLRYEKTFKRSLKYLKSNLLVLELGAAGWFTKYLELGVGCVVEHTDTDLRYPLPLPDNTYDVVFNLEIIEHINDRNTDDILTSAQFNYNGIDSLLSESYRVLKPGGVTVLTTPNVASLDVIYKVLIGEVPMHYAPHVREFTIGTLVERVKMAGFQVMEAFTENVWGTADVNSRALVQKILESNGFSTTNRGNDIFLIAKK
jgi:SAM-dependent methyltransferase